MARTTSKKKDNVKKEVKGPKTIKFRLLKGAHYEIDRTKKIKAGRATRKRYVTGDIIESIEDLSKKFKNKFVRVDDDMNETPQKAKGFRTFDRGGDRYDVVNEITGKVINENFLTLEQAKRLEQAASAPIDEFPEDLIPLLYQPQDGQVQMPDGSVMKEEEPGLV